MVDEQQPIHVFLDVNIWVDVAEGVTTLEEVFDRVTNAITMPTSNKRKTQNAAWLIRSAITKSSLISVDTSPACLSLVAIKLTEKWNWKAPEIKKYLNFIQKISNVVPSAVPNASQINFAFNQGFDFERKNFSEDFEIWLTAKNAGVKTIITNDRKFPHDVENIVVQTVYEFYLDPK